MTKNRKRRLYPSQIRRRQARVEAIVIGVTATVVGLSFLVALAAVQYTNYSAYLAQFH